MNINDVVKRFIAISEISDTSLDKWLPLCSEAYEFIKSRIKKSQLSKGEEIRLCNATAVYAYYKYCLYNSKTDIKSFTAGDVRIDNSELLAQSAKSLWEYESECISDLIDNGSFAFERIKI